MIVFCLPPHTTHVTQPLDSICFGALKRRWGEECHNFLTENPGRVVTRYQFSELFHRAWVRAMTGENITAGFRSTGVYPFNRDTLNPSQRAHFDPSSLPKETGLNYISLYSPK